MAVKSYLHSKINKMKISPLLIAAAILLSASLQAQTAQTRNQRGAGYFGAGLLLDVPVQQYKEFNDEIGAGIGISFLYQPSIDIPLLAGIDIGFIGNGNKTQYETIYADVTVGGTVIDELEFPFRIETNNSIFTGHFMLRALAPIKYFKPYIDGIVGFNNFSTNTSIYDESEEHYFSEDDNPLITQKNQISDWTLSYGGAFGLMVQLGSSFFIDVRCAYAIGGEADYYTEDDIENWDVEFTTTPSTTDDLGSEDIDISAIPKRSETTMLQPSLGVMFRF